MDDVYTLGVGGGEIAIGDAVKSRCDMSEAERTDGER
jgi:hypothetical protein